jgi:hypothetical protein
MGVFCIYVTDPEWMCTLWHLIILIKINFSENLYFGFELCVE